MIRFSAALVAVAIGVLIGGGVTSKLPVVYIAVLISAVALIVLAIGVALRREELREELFGEGQAPAPAVAGVSAGLPVSTGDSQGRTGQDRVSQNERVSSSPPSPFAGAAGTPDPGQHLSGRHAYASSPLAGSAGSSAGTIGSADSLRGVAGGKDVPANPPAPWETRTSREPWSTPARDRDGQPSWAGSASGTSAGRDDTRPPWSSGQHPGDRPVPSWQPLPGFTPSVGAGGSSAGGSSAAPTQAGSAQAGSSPAGSTAWTMPAFTPTPSRPEAGGGREADPPSWFDRPGRPTEPANTEPANTEPANTAANTDVDDDWPTRYSWLDDDVQHSDPAEPAESSETESSETDNVIQGEQDAPVHRDEPADSIATDTAAPAEDDAEAEAGTSDHTAPGDDGAVDSAVESADDSTAGDDSPADDNTADGDGTSGQPGSVRLVTVVPGVPRYHDGNCILIRFMQDDDVHKVTIPAARETGCTPCAACQPED